ncbi:MAG: HEAT repeat domain-containing protein [Longimicrobiales bacterium]
MITVLGSRVKGAGVVLAALATYACGTAVDADTETYADIVREEDARGTLGRDAIQSSLTHTSSGVRVFAVRALGRFEDPSLIPEIAALAQDSAPSVRAAVAWSLGQAVYGSDGSPVLPHLESALRGEQDPSVVGALATTTGRVITSDRAGVERQLALLETAQSSLSGLTDAELLGSLGYVRGLEALARQRAEELTTGQADNLARQAAAAIQESATGANEGGTESAVRIRGLATAALAHANRLEGDLLSTAMRDPWPEVRRQALLSVTRHGSDYRTLISPQLSDPVARVRVAALSAFERWLRPTQGCGPILEALDDRDAHVALTAVDLLARPCPDRGVQRDALLGLVADRDTADSANNWHVPARALWALGGVAPEAAREHLESWAGHESPFARAWVARAATQTGSRSILRALAQDSDANVRTAAIIGLDRLEGGGAEDIYVDQLTSDDPQLVMTATRLLRTDNTSAVPHVIEALERFTALERENSRDVRLALLGFLGQAPDVDPEVFEPLVSDFDPAISEEAAAHLSAHTGTAVVPTPTPLPTEPPPSAQRIAELAASSVVLEMIEGGNVVIALRPDLAATNADRFARLAETGYLNGLTLHRVVPNFVIQGGSPGANEYWGDALFSRDEISDAVHWRATVGLSTRGRDTGDGQLFVNLVDNPRLDFNYTIYGEVVEGIRVVDRIQEGAVIRRARLVSRRNP